MRPLLAQHKLPFGDTSTLMIVHQFSGGSRHSTRGNLIGFPVSHLHFFVGGESKSIATLDGGMAGFSPFLDPPLHQFLCHPMRIVSFRITDDKKMLSLS